MTQMDKEQAAADVGLEPHIEAEIMAARRQLRAEQSTASPGGNKSCPTCARVPRAGDLYCRGCGTQLAPVCPKCETIVDTTDHFCVSCGIELALAMVG